VSEDDSSPVPLEGPIEEQTEYGLPARHPRLKRILAGVLLLVAAGSAAVPVLLWLAEEEDAGRLGDRLYLLPQDTVSVVYHDMGKLRGSAALDRGLRQVMHALGEVGLRLDAQDVAETLRASPPDRDESCIVLRTTRPIGLQEMLPKARMQEHEGFGCAVLEEPAVALARLDERTYGCSRSEGALRRLLNRCKSRRPARWSAHLRRAIDHVRRKDHYSAVLHEQTDESMPLAAALGFSLGEKAQFDAVCIFRDAGSAEQFGRKLAERLDAELREVESDLAAGPPTSTPSGEPPDVEGFLEKRRERIGTARVLRAVRLRVSGETVCWEAQVSAEAAGAVDRLYQATMGGGR
jgi:hypothetical protein